MKAMSGGYFLGFASIQASFAEFHRRQGADSRNQPG
jgi:hypothetical protein